MPEDAPKREVRVMPTEFRVIRDDDKPTRIEGYAAVCGKRSLDLGGWVEIIEPGAFAHALDKNPDVRALVNHDPNLVLGRTKSGTLALKEDRTGLWMSDELPDTQVARDLAVSIERGDIDQESFAFDLAPGGDDWVKDPDSAEYVRHIRQIENLYDVSVVTYPAYPDTTAALRSMQDTTVALRSLKAVTETVEPPPVTEPEPEPDAEPEPEPQPPSVSEARRRRLKRAQENYRQRVRARLLEDTKQS